MLIFVTIYNQTKMFLENSCYETLRSKRGVGKSSGGRKDVCVVCEACTSGIPTPFHRCHEFVLFRRQNNASQRANLAFFRALKPAKHKLFLVSQMKFGQKNEHEWCFLHRLASLDCCRCAFYVFYFCQLFHLLHGIQRTFIRLKQLFPCSLPCYLMHLALFFA